MLHKYRYYFLFGFIALLLLIVFISESVLSQKRLDYVIDYHQQALDNIAFVYDLNLDASAPDSIASATPPIIPAVPDDPILQNVLEEFPSFLRESRTFAERTREKYSEIDADQRKALRITEERQEYEIETGNGSTVRLSFLGKGKLESIIIQSDEDKRSLSISYYPDGSPDRLLFGMWSNESMGINLKFHRNRTPQEYVYIFKGALFGPSIFWKEDGSIRKAEFYKRPKPITFDKRAD